MFSFFLISEIGRYKAELENMRKELKSVKMLNHQLLEAQQSNRQAYSSRFVTLSAFF